VEIALILHVFELFNLIILMGILLFSRLENLPWKFKGFWDQV